MTMPPLPSTVDAINPRQWETFSPYFEELQRRPLTTDSVRHWLADWSALSELLEEAFAVIYVEKTIDTADTEKEAAFLDMINEVIPQSQIADQKLKERMLGLGKEQTAALGDDMALVLRKMRNAAELFHEDNVPLQTELSKLENEYDKITGAMAVEWDGEEKNLSQLEVFLEEKERGVRERAWQAIMNLWLGKRAEINQIYADMLALRKMVAANAGLPDYRAYTFRTKERFDYTPEDCFTFHEAIEEVVVPAAGRIYEKKAAQLGLDCLRPWDTEVDTGDAPPLKPYQGQDSLVQGSLNIFHQIDPVLAGHLATMAEEELLDLETRPGKALGGYCMTFPVRKRPFIFMNGAGTHDNVQTMLHEAGHAFHVFETAAIPLTWQGKAPMEFCEVASMSMELLAAPHLQREGGGFYTPSEAARARIQHLERVVTFLPYMAVVDAFQHWVYTHVDEAMDSANCDAAWDRLWARFMPGVNWEGLEAARMTGWHRKIHIFGSPFYYIEYGMAQVGALQVWRNSLTDLPGAVQSYRDALSLGGTRTLPELFTTAGVEFRFDRPMLSSLVGLMEETIGGLEEQV
jgi:oligoendopeptidase F